MCSVCASGRGSVTLIRLHLGVQMSLQAVGGTGEIFGVRSCVILIAVGHWELGPSQTEDL